MPIPSGTVPLGYGFRPFDEELITHLERKNSGSEENEIVIAEIKFYEFDPWELPAKSKIENDNPPWFFFYLNQPKYSSRDRLNRATKSGSWKPTGEDRTITSMESGQEIGSKKTLVFFQVRGPKTESACWTMHEYSSVKFESEDSYVVCRLFKNQETKQRKKRKKVIECSNDTEHAIKSEVQWNLRTEEEFSAQPADEVNSNASLNVIQEENNFLIGNFDTYDDGVEMNEILNPCEDNKEIIVGEAGNGEFPPVHSDNELLNENFASEFYLLNRHNNSGASRILLRGESIMTSANVDTDNVGAENNEEVLQNKIYNEEVLKYYAETLLPDSPPNLGDNLMASQTVNTHDWEAETRKYSDALQNPEETKADETINDVCQDIPEIILADSLPNFDDDSTASHFVIQEGSGVMSANVDADDLGVENNSLLDVDQSAIIHSDNEFLNENCISEFVDPLFNFDDASDLITENQIPEMDFDSVTFNSSSSYNFRTTPSENQLIRHAGGADHRILNESASEGSTNHYAETGITIRPRHTRVSASDPSQQHQGTAPRRILLLSKYPLDESCERIKQPKLGRSWFALVLVMPVLVIVYAGWKWFKG